MKPSVLEANVRALLRKSYVPALPAPHFRDRLESLFLAEAARRAPRRVRVLPRLVAAAAVLAALLLGWRALAPAAAATRAGLLAAGEVALGLPDGSWRAADAEQRFHGLHFTPPTLVVVTPAGVELDVLVAGGRLHLGERSELLLSDDGERALLRAGTAVFHVHDTSTALVPGHALELPAAVRAALPPLTAAVGSGAREALEPAPPRARVDEPPAASARVLGGRVVDAASGAPLGAFHVALLRERLGNETHPPTVRAFEDADGRFAWTDPPGGKQRIFVHAAGHALLELGEFDLDQACPQVEARLEVGLSLRGSVLDRQGNPLADALVLSEHDAPTDGLLLGDGEEFGNALFWLPISTRTGRDGRFVLEHLNPGRHTLRASAAGHAPGWLEGALAGDASGELVLRLGPGGTIVGQVAGADGQPTPNAEVVVVAMDQVARPCTNFALTRTDQEGAYRFEHLPPTTMIVVLIRSDDRPDVRPLQVQEEAELRVDFLAARRGARLSGHVRDARGAPVVGQNLGLFVRDTASWNQNWVASTTNDAGGYLFEGVLPGRYQLFLIDALGRGLRGVDELELSAGTLELEHEVRLPDGELEVLVRAAEGGETVDEAYLVLERLEPDGAHTFLAIGTTASDGRFTFSHLRPGSYHVWAYPTRPGLGFASSEPLALGADGRGRCELRLPLGGVASLRVHDPAGRPLEGALVSFRDEQGHEHTFSRLPYSDSSGRYLAVGLRPGRYRAAVRLAGFEDAVVPFHCILGDEREVSIPLTPVAPR